MRLTFATFVLLTPVLLGVLPTPVAFGQGATSNCNAGSTGAVLQLPGGASYTLSSGGCVAGHTPGFQLGGSGSGAASSGSLNAAAPMPPSAATISPPVDVLALDLAIRSSNASRCLTQLGFVCRAAPGSAGRLNDRSTRIDVNWLIQQLGNDVFRDAALPDIQLRANPDPGITGIPTWFWVDPASYGGQAFSYSVDMPAQWTEYWDELVHHHDVTRAPCPEDAARTCTSSHDWDELVHHQQDHTDYATVTVTFSPVQFAWDFGDDPQHSRADGHAAFSDQRGMGQPFTAASTPSPVAHNYDESSLRVYEQGGFPIQLSVTWSANATWHFTSDLGDNASGTLAFGSRVGQYAVRHQVRESQPVLVARSP